MLDPNDIIRRLHMKPHPEGGFFVETFRDIEGAGKRAASTAIYYLLRAGEKSRWHRIDAAEIWHFYAGDPLRLSIADHAGLRAFTLGPRLDRGETPQVVVARGAWQAAEPLGAYALVGCTVAPGFDFATFELAPDDFDPAQA